MVVCLAKKLVQVTDILESSATGLLAAPAEHGRDPSSNMRGPVGDCRSVTPQVAAHPVSYHLVGSFGC